MVQQLATILAIETATSHGSVALQSPSGIESVNIGAGVKASEVLLSIIDRLFKNANTSLQQCDKIVCGVGPGAFTGVRLALSVAKMFAYVNTIPCVGVSSLENMAYQGFMHSPDKGFYDVFLDARMQEYYYARYAFTAAAHPTMIKPAVICRDGEKATDALCISDCFAADLYAVPTAKAALEYTARFSPPSVSAVELAPLYVRNKVALTLEERAEKYSN